MEWCQLCRQRKAILGSVCAPAFREPRNRFRGIDSVRLGVEGSLKVLYIRAGGWGVGWELCVDDFASVYSNEQPLKGEWEDNLPMFILN